MVQLGKDPGLNKERLDIKGASDSFRVGHLDGHRAIEIIIAGKVDGAEPAPTETMNDPIAPNPGRTAVRDSDRPIEGDLAGLVDNAHAGVTTFHCHFGIVKVAACGAAQQVAVGSDVGGTLSRLARVARLFDCGVGRGWRRSTVALVVGERVKQVVTSAGIPWD